MENIPKDQSGGPRNAEGTSDDGAVAVSLPQATETETGRTEYPVPNNKGRWVQDPLMAALSAAGLLALIVYSLYPLYATDGFRHRICDP
jgi:hypothetical protein